MAWLDVNVKESVPSSDVNPSLPWAAVMVIVGTEVSWRIQTVATVSEPSTVTVAVTLTLPSLTDAMFPPAPAPDWKLQLQAPVEA